MSRLITLIATVGAALAVAVPAGLGAERPDPWSVGMNRLHGLGEYAPEVRAERLRSEGMNRVYGLGEFAPSVTAERLRSEGMNRVYGLGEFAPNVRAERLRSEGLNKLHGLGDYSTQPTAPVSATGSGVEIPWPQVGIFGIGIVLILGLVFVGAMRHRRLAH
jgi:hypothetical protein